MDEQTLFLHINFISTLHFAYKLVLLLQSIHSGYLLLLEVATGEDWLVSIEFTC